MRRALLAALLLAAMPAAGLELRAYAKVDACCRIKCTGVDRDICPPAGHGPCDGGSCVRNEPCWVGVNANYSGSDACVVATIPPSAVWLSWVANDLWEKPPVLSDADKRRLAGDAKTYDGWKRLTCGARKSSSGWSFSCFNSGLYQDPDGTWQRPDHVTLGVEGVHTGTAAALDATVRGWWGAQR